MDFDKRYKKGQKMFLFQQGDGNGEWGYASVKYCDYDC